MPSLSKAVALLMEKSGWGKRKKFGWRENIPKTNDKKTRDFLPSRSSSSTVCTPNKPSRLDDPAKEDDQGDDNEEDDVEGGFDPESLLASFTSLE